MTLVSFEAGICTLDENIEDEYHMVAFADKESYPENYVLLQRAFEFDEHDLECGLDGPYCEVNNPECSGYKCCIRAVLNSDSLKLVLRPGSLQDLDSVRIGLSEAVRPQKLGEFLRVILGDIFVVE